MGCCDGNGLKCSICNTVKIKLNYINHSIKDGKVYDNIECICVNCNNTWIIEVEQKD